MDGVTALAQHIKNRDNPSPYTPMFGIKVERITTVQGKRIFEFKDGYTSEYKL